MHSSNQKLVKVNPVPFMFGSFFRQRDKFPVKVLCTSMIILELTCIWSKVLWKYYCLVASLQTYCSYFSKREERHIYVKKNWWKITWQKTMVAGGGSCYIILKYDCWVFGPCHLTLTVGKQTCWGINILAFFSKFISSN